MSRPVVIAGGSGEVGSLLAARLAPVVPVVLAARRRERVAERAGRIGHGARPAQLDAREPDSIERLLADEEPIAVVSCVARAEATLARGCLVAGVHYVDVTADGPGIAAVEGLSPVGEAGGATGALSVGLTPGLTNLLARDLCEGIQVTRLDLGVRLSLDDVHGAAATSWTLENLGGTYLAPARGRMESLRPFARRRRLDFGSGSTTTAGAFNFPEQRTLVRTLGVPTARSWIALAPSPVHVAVTLAARSRLTGLLRFGRVRAGVADLLGRLPSHEGEWAIAVEVAGTRDGESVRRSASRSGRGEAATTARVAELVTHLVLEGGEPHGVLHIEQLRGWRHILAELTS